MNTNTDDLQAGFAHAAEISAKRDSAIVRAAAKIGRNM